MFPYLAQIVIYLVHYSIQDEMDPLHDAMKNVQNEVDYLNSSITTRENLTVKQIETYKSEYLSLLALLEAQVKEDNSTCAQIILNQIKQIKDETKQLDGCRRDEDLEEVRNKTLPSLKALIQKAENQTKICKNSRCVEDSADELYANLSAEKNDAVKKIEGIGKDISKCFEDTTSRIRQNVDDLLISWEACKNENNQD